jgi:glyoxylase-like metal-dependent hydrolase (beta-lactamase superfamily II)
MIHLPQGLTFFERGWLSSNNILLHDASQAILIDTGYHTHAAQTLALVQSALSVQPLNRILNTHLHSDHCGGNAFLYQAYPSLEIHIPKGHAHFVDAWDANGLTYEPTGQACPQFKKSDVLLDGDTFEIAGVIWQVLAAAGHDPHSIILFNESHGILISADALWENGFGVVFPEIEGVSAFDEVEETLDIIENLAPQVVLPGHGSAFNDASSAIARARSRLAQFRSAPEKHANYASKVLLKFKLLELQHVELNNFLDWADRVTYLHLLHKKYAGNTDYRDWILFLCQELEKSGVCQLKQGSIVNS